MDFQALAIPPQDICRAIFDALSVRASPEAVHTPQQGVNNRTYLLPDVGLSVKVRPPSDGLPETPCLHWPEYTCQLLGAVPNGELETISAVTEELEMHGSLPVPEVMAFDDACCRLPGPYLVARMLPGSPFDWENRLMGKQAAQELGRHLGRLHSNTQQSNGYGIFKDPSIPLGDWRARFEASFNRLLDDVIDASPRLEMIRSEAGKDVRKATASTAPKSSSLICIDQNPSHYLGDDSGRITGFVDVEGHLWAPPEWEISLVLAWIHDHRAFRDGYREFHPWPTNLADVRPAYTAYTYLEWIYCLRTLSPDSTQVSVLEERLLEKIGQAPKVRA